MQKVKGKAFRVVPTNTGWLMVDWHGSTVATGRFFCTCCNRPTDDRRHACADDEVPPVEFIPRAHA